jgi:D-ribose pyranase
LIAGLGHKDLVLIGDAGLPIPPGVEIVDLALCLGVPTFEQVLDAVMEETVVEYYYLAGEIAGKNDRLFTYIKETLPDIEYTMVPHVDFKEMTKNVKFAIRTGEATPYPNIILRAGVAFPA